MLMKKHYHPDGLVSHIEVKHTGANPEQNFSAQMVMQAVEEGWMSLSRGKLMLHTADDEDDLVYDILRGPGRYCCHCTMKLPDDALGESARRHVAQEHNGEESPDPQNPSGYKRINHYECVLGAEQHALYHAQAS